MMDESIPRAALVTGGARRIGRAVVEALARAGYSVAIHVGRSVDEGEALAATLRAAGGQAGVVQADLANPDAVAGLVPAAVAAVGPLTLLVNSASEFEPDGMGSMSVPLWNRHFSVNLRAPVFLTEAFAAQAPAAANPCVINIIDQRVWKLTPQFTSYTLTKSALLTATKTLAQALAPSIRVNAVAPGPTLTNTRQGEADFARQSAAVLLGRGGTADEIAEAVLFLAHARSVTGQMLAVDGGQHLAWETPDVAGIAE